MAKATRDAGVLKPDLCIIGAGAAGLTVAVAAAAMRVPVVLIERGHMGGDCLNFGCVPSKALLAAGHHAASARAASTFGIDLPEPRIDAARVADHVAEVIAGIAPIDSEGRMRALGITVLRAEAKFVSDRELEAGGQRVRARRFVIATGSRPFVPPIPGLKGIPFLTNETIFTLRQTPEHLIVIGGGPIGSELAQAHRRLGAEVTIVEAARLLSREDREAAELVAAALEREGVRLLEGATVRAARATSEGVTLTIERGGVEAELQGSHLLVATGRSAVTDTLALDKAGVAVEKQGVKVDSGLRTTNRRIYAVGDVAGGPQFTHVAGHQASLVLRSALFRLKVAFRPERMPRVTYTDPELAHVGLSEDEARAAGRFEILRWPFAENDRARAERHGPGFIKVMLDGKRRILGATIVGPQAGELILPWVLAIEQNLKISAMAGLIAPYPTLSEVSKRSAMQIYAKDLRNPWLGRLLKVLRMLG